LLVTALLAEDVQLLLRRLPGRLGQPVHTLLAGDLVLDPRISLGHSRAHAAEDADWRAFIGQHPFAVRRVAVQFCGHLGVGRLGEFLAGRLEGFLERLQPGFSAGRRLRVVPLVGAGHMPLAVAEPALRHLVGPGPVRARAPPGGDDRVGHTWQAPHAALLPSSGSGGWSA
jgi:hypothetical protein